MVHIADMHVRVKHPVNIILHSLRTIIHVHLTKYHLIDVCFSFYTVKNQIMSVTLSLPTPHRDFVSTLNSTQKSMKIDGIWEAWQTNWIESVRNCPIRLPGVSRLMRGLLVGPPWNRSSE